MKTKTKHHYILACRGNAEFIVRCSDTYDVIAVMDILVDKMYSLERTTASYYTAQLVKNHPKNRGLKTYDVPNGKGHHFDPGE